MKSILRTAAAGVALATFGIASGVSAQTTATANAEAEILSTLSVAVDAGDNVLNFGTIADQGIVGPTPVVVDAAGARTCGASLICGGTPAAPTFDVEGLTGALVDVSFVNASESLTTGVVPTGMTGTMNVSTFTTNLAGNQILLDGTDAFTVGGTLTVNPLQAPGVYTGTVGVSVAYN